MDHTPTDRSGFVTPLLSLQQLPWTTKTRAGVGGVIKQIPEDFQVEELPLYLPCGQGEHLFLWIEKRDLDAGRLRTWLSQALEVSESDIGMAGLKDKRAVTRQYVSVPRACEPRLSRVASDHVRILSVTAHTNKLRTGHLRGNRFQILLRGAQTDLLPLAEETATQLRRDGLANFFGPQRFGSRAATAAEGFQLLQGAGDKRSAKRRNRARLRLALSAAQAWLFNDVLRERLERGTQSRVRMGDVLRVGESGGAFVTTDPAIDQPRVDRGELSVSGPLFGRKMVQPQGEAAHSESASLERYGLEMTDFNRYPRLTQGGRRSLVVFPEALSVQVAADGLLLTFSLPPGSYATVLVREFLKHDADFC